jgi:UDP-glucose 4-epimerase
MTTGDTSVVVTGASGFVGSRLVDALGSARTRPIVRKAAPWLADSQVEADLLDPSVDLVDLMGGAAAVVHLAGQNEVVAATDPDRALADSVVMTRRVADAAARARVKRLIYVSTVHVYGAQMQPGAVLDERQVPEPRSVYAVARLASEHLAASAAAGDVDVAVLRLTNAVGAPADPGVDRWTLVAADLCREATVHGTLTLRSSGQQWRDFVSLTDVCRTLAGAAIGPTPLVGTFNLASGTSTTVRGLAELIADRHEAHTGTRPVLQAPDPDGPDPLPYHVSTERLAAEGWRLDTPLARAVDELVELCVANCARLAREEP